MSGASLRPAGWISAICLALAGASPALAQSPADDDIAIEQKVLGPASMFPDEISKMSPTDLVAANAALRAGADHGLREGGLTYAPTELDVTSEVVDLGGHGVLKTRVQVPSQVFYYQYSGVAKGDALILVCVSKAARPFSPSGTECERRANAVFGGGAG